MVNVIKYSVIALALVVCVVTVSVTRADAYVRHVRSKRTIGYLFRNLVNTFAPSTQKPAPALPTAQPLKIIPAPASSKATSATPSTVYKKKNYSPTMPAPDSEVIKPPIRPLVFPVVSSVAPPVTAYYYQIFPSTTGAADEGGIANTKSENYVSITEKPSRPTERAPIKAQLIIFPFSTANPGNVNVNRDNSYNSNNNDNDDDQVTITRLPLEKRKPIERPPFNYRAEIFVHPRGTSGTRTSLDSYDDDDDDDDDDDGDDYRSYESKENLTTDKKKWLEVEDLLNPSQKRNSKNNGDNNVEITKEKMVKICSVDENKPLTYNKQEQPGGVNKDIEYVKTSRNRGKEVRTRTDDDDDREEEEPDASDKEEDDGNDERGSKRPKEVKTEKYRPPGRDDKRLDYYRQNKPAPNLGRIVGDFYINLPHSINRGGYDFSVDHARNNHGQATDGLFSMDRRFPVSHQKMDQFLPQTIFQNPFLAPQNTAQQKKTNNYFPYNGANSFGNYNFGKTNNHNPINNVFPLLTGNLHDFPTTVPHTTGTYDDTTDRSFTTYDNKQDHYNNNQNNQGGHSESENHKEHETDDDHSGEKDGHEEEEKHEDEESDDEDRKYSFSNDDHDDENDNIHEEESDKDDNDEDDEESSQAEEVEDSHNDDSGKNNEPKSTVVLRHAVSPRLPTALHEEVQHNEGRQLQYIQHPPVFDMSADRSEQSTICFNMFGQRIICS